MASIQRKIIHGRPYYYLSESRRVNGRPGPVVLQYLGSADSCSSASSISSSPPPVLGLSHFGVSRPLHLAQHCSWSNSLINRPQRRQGPSRAVPARRRHQPLLGTHQQATDAAGSAHSLLVGWALLRNSFPGSVSGQHGITWDKPSRHQRRPSPSACSSASTGGEQPGLDCTNFDTFIDTEKSQPLPSGSRQSKRSDLRIVGLALLVSLDFHFPCCGGLSRITRQRSLCPILEELTQRYQALP